MKDKLGDKARLEHIRDSIADIQAYTQGVEYADFSQNRMLLLAVIKLLEIIGEATNHISEDLQRQHAEVAWREIIGLRHILVHQYFEISPTLIWRVIQSDLDTFKAQIERIYQEL